jgi:hypothetical protein
LSVISRLQPRKDSRRAYRPFCLPGHHAHNASRVIRYPSSGVAPALVRPTQVHVVCRCDDQYPAFVRDLRKPDLRRFGEWVSRTAADALTEEGLDPSHFGRLDPGSVVTAKTASRSSLGFMTEMALQIQYAVDDDGLQHLDVAALNRSLRRTLHQRDGRYVTPMDPVTGLDQPSI